MDNNLIKALRCLASKNDDGECHMDFYNSKYPNKCPIYCGSSGLGGGILCPYYQTKYSTVFGEEECREWLNAVADMMDIFGVNTEHSGGVENSCGKEQK